MHDRQDYQSPQRNYSLDMVRVLAMFLVVLHHVMCTTGLKNVGVPISAMTEWWYGFLHSLSVIDVDLFAILTGYLCIGKKWKIGRWVKLWVLVFFYGMVISYLGKLAGGNPFPVKYVLQNLVPFMSTYWYFSAYTALFFVVPFINRALAGLNVRQWRFLLCVLFLVFSVGDSMLQSQFRIYGTDGGHSALWLGVLYIFGAYFKVHPLNIRKSYLLSAWSTLIIMQAILIKETILPIGEFQHPIICLAAISCFLLLISFHLRSKAVCNILKWLSPMAFSVYLIHIGLYRFMETELPTLFMQLNYPCWLPLAVAVLIYISCTLMDYLRLHLFRWARVDALCERLVSKLPDVMRKQEW